MHRFPNIHLWVSLFCLALSFQTLQAATVLVDSQDAYREALKKAVPGDTIRLKNGTWPDFEILFSGQGEPGRPITLTAETKGQVILTGRANLRLAGRHLVVSGLVFRDGWSPTNTVIAFRRNKKERAYHSRVTEVVIDHYNPPARFENSFWVVMAGKHNRFDHNHLVGKTNQGVTMAVRLDHEDDRENHHRIDHNYFGPRPVLGANGGETLRIGTSKYSLTQSATLVENNVFDRCNGEVEIISVKSGGNILRGNLFLESQGTLTLRHGNDNLVENNLFLGNGRPHTGGIRVINKRQTVRNNYFEGLTGHRFGAALVIMNGVPDSPINRYHQVEDSLIENNSLIDCNHIELAAGADAERSAPPIRTDFRNNLIVHRAGKPVIAVYDDLSGVRFENNLHHPIENPLPLPGFIAESVKMSRGANGLLYPEPFPGVGTSPSLSNLNLADTGVAWYPKPDRDPIFDTGRTLRVAPQEGALAAALADAKAGDRLLLAPGEHHATTILVVDKPITLAAAQPDQSTRLSFARSSLFELAEGGSLKLTGLTLTGASAPDRAGNSLIRTSRTGLRHNYRLVVENTSVRDLNTNHSFHFFSPGKHTFADQIRLHNCHFSNLTGHVLHLNKEPEDLGVYNGETIEIRDSTFTDIAGTLADIYRGGTDESTFGPRFTLHRAKLARVGGGTRNKSDASLRLWGVQDTQITDILVEDSRPIRIQHTVGEPRTRLINPQFINTPQPVIRERHDPSGNEPSGNEPFSAPTLLLSAAEADTLRDNLMQSPRFQRSLAATEKKVIAYFRNPPDVPQPTDPGGGYTHEQHKRNGVAIHDAGILYQITGNEEHAHRAVALLKAYADLYPGLGPHPQQKKQAPGRLFWQSLNEAVWLTYAVQGAAAVWPRLSRAERKHLESGLLRPMAEFLSSGQPRTFDKIHNHGTWAAAAVGMTGYLLGDKAYVEKALYGLKRDGSAGFLKQLDRLFSPDGYYTEGPYYQRYALMPVILFAAAIHNNEPERAIFQYRDQIILKAVRSCVDLSYNGLFFPINDAIKSKGLDTVELRYGIAAAYRLTGDAGLLSIAQNQSAAVLTRAGFETARAIDQGLARPYPFQSRVLRDGPSGKQGALVVMRDGSEIGHQALVFKATAQGMGHGHFDKLNWLFYDNGHEIITDYGAARFLNVPQKNGGRYLPENQSWAKQTAAHNTLVVDQRSHFDGKRTKADAAHPHLTFWEQNERIHIAAATMTDAYPGLQFQRTLAQIKGPGAGPPMVVDLLKVTAKGPHQYDLPLHFAGRLIASTPRLVSETNQLHPLGQSAGYQHLWRRAQAKTREGRSFSVTWLHGSRFYTYTTLAERDDTLLLAELGAQDPDFNLRPQQALILRTAPNRGNHTFVSVLEPHGATSAAEETTVGTQGRLRSLSRITRGDLDLIQLASHDGTLWYLAVSHDARADQRHQISHDDTTFTWQGFYGLFNHQGETL
ncbi:chondroitinase-B domain-containing protein [Acanthopleuribacter pedis]|uniref:Heparinase II/III family protein n=1 Tax=Acanthopleuribacter pedis TaxID=442870 RepID=A0A8J7QGK9_9BACT|nr:chondroitinase-B domain-containing protein [Acanthopleuribacter pedis]MBO1321915.1 heparinase II/III family protein [Acanthopleuribacter pedis]